MLLNENGGYIRDIDIEELSVSLGGHCGRSVILTKHSIKFRQSVQPTIAFLTSPSNCYDEKIISISSKQFNEISDAVHNAGLLEILSPVENAELPADAAHKAMRCTFDDGSHYRYCERKTNRSKTFESICHVLFSYCKCNSLSNEPVTIAMPKSKLVPVCEDIDKEKEAFFELLKNLDEMKGKLKRCASFLTIYDGCDEGIKDTIGVLQESFQKISDIEIQLTSQIDIYDRIKDRYITWG